LLAFSCLLLVLDSFLLELRFFFGRYFLERIHHTSREVDRRVPFAVAATECSVDTNFSSLVLSKQ
jgi:hypothetical protein